MARQVLRAIRGEANGARGITGRARLRRLTVLGPRLRSSHRRQNTTRGPRLRRPCRRRSRRLRRSCQRRRHLRDLWPHRSHRRRRRQCKHLSRSLKRHLRSCRRHRRRRRACRYLRRRSKIASGLARRKRRSPRGSKRTIPGLGTAAGEDGECCRKLRALSSTGSGRRTRGAVGVTPIRLCPLSVIGGPTKASFLSRRHTCHPYVPHIRCVRSHRPQISVTRS